MLGHYLLTLYRSLTRHRLYAALNILGLAIGVAVFLVLFLNVRYETGFDRWIPEAQNTYRVDATTTVPGQAVRRTASTSQVAGPLLKADYPQITAFTRMVEEDEPVTVGLTSDTEEIQWVDSDFFKVLDLPLAEGDTSTALSQPGNVVISERLARKYFGTTRAVGRTLTASLDGDKSAYRVSAVLRDLPANTHLVIDVLVPITPAFQASHTAFTRWHSQSGSTYLRFRDKAGAQSVQADLVNFIERRAKGDGEMKIGPHPTHEIRYALTALPDIHFHDASFTDTQKPGVDRRVVASLAVVGAFTLVIAILNYINLATARSALRAREVAVRKVLGATRRALIGQFLAEAMAMAVVAVLIGLALSELALPLVNATGGTSLKLTYLGKDGVLPILLGVALFIGLGAGLYPAFLLSNFEPAKVLAASRMPGGGRLSVQVRNGLVLLQFAAAIAFTICTLVLSAQAKFLHDADRGFSRQGLILVDSLQSKDMKTREDAILTALRATPGVTLVSMSNREPAAGNMNINNISRPGLSGPEPLILQEMVGQGYLETYGAHLVAGRGFDDAHRLDDISDKDDAALRRVGANAMLNETAVKTLGFSSPAASLGKPLRLGPIPLTVIGVVHDIRFQSPQQPVGPVFYMYQRRGVPQAVAAVRYQGIDDQTMAARLAQSWRRVAPGVPFIAKTADVRLSDYYVPDERRARLFTLGAVLAVAIGCVGLYGLASFNTARRTKEIGIRKALGASTGDIMRLLIGQFLKPVAIANLIAWPLAWFAMRNWLSSFDQRISLSPLFFLAATALALVIAVATVAGQAFKVAREEPGRALRYE